MDEPYQYLLDLTEREPPSLDNFVVGDNAEVLNVLRLIKAGMGPKFIYLFGPQGSGVTHLLRSLVPEEPLWVPSFSSERHLYTVDNVEALDLGWSLQLRNLQNTIRQTPGATLVCGGKLPIHQLPLTEDITSRLGWGVMYAVQPLDDVSRSEALRQHAYKRGIALTDDVLGWMGAHLPRDMRTLMCVLNEVDRLGLEKQRRVTVPLVKEALLTLKHRAQES